jgi:hypothetical protein
MKRSDLIVGQRYLFSSAFGVQTVTYLGPVPGWSKRCRVRGLVDRKVVWVPLETLLPFLHQVVSR